MIRALKTALAVVLLASPAFANSNVNVSVNTFSIYSDRITEVEVDGGGLYTFPDPLAAPELSEENQAIETALAGLGYPVGTTATVQQTSSIGNDEVVDRVVTSSHNPIDDPAIVIGLPDDYLTWIAIGAVDVQVDVELTTTFYEFYRLVVAITPPCGDGTLQAGEACDDGNAEDGDCCSSTCQHEALGSSCDDGVVCTALDTCDGAGACQSGGPATTCISWPKANLLIKEKKAGKEKLIAKFLRGPALGQGDFGNPEAGSTGYEICVFDDAGNLAGSMSVDRAGDLCAQKACWKAKKETGWQYKDKSAASDGVTKVKLFGGSAGKTQIQVQAGNNGKKGQLSMPVGVAAALMGTTSATVQVLASDAQCFDVTLNQIKKQEQDFFKAIKK